MKSRPPQLSLQLGTEMPDPAARWHDGTRLSYLDRTLTVTASLSHHEPALEGDHLHLPLPPHATPQQIRDRAESWLREQALRHFSARLRTLGGNPAPAVKLSFAARGPWVEPEDGQTLRCNWRLIEQAPAVIDQTLNLGLKSLAAAEPELDLFGFAFSARPPGAA